MSRPPHLANVEALYTNENWEKRRPLLLRKIWGQLLCALAIVLAALYCAVFDIGSVDLFNTLITIVVPALLAAASADTYTWVTGSVTDDKHKRELLPPPKIDDRAGMQPPDGFAEGN